MWKRLWWHLFQRPVHPKVFWPPYRAPEIFGPPSGRLSQITVHLKQNSAGSSFVNNSVFSIEPSSKWIHEGRDEVVYRIFWKSRQSTRKRYYMT